MRDPDGFRESLEHVISTYGIALTVDDVCKLDGCCKRTAVDRYTGWDGIGRGKRIPTVKYVRQVLMRSSKIK